MISYRLGNSLKMYDWIIKEVNSWNQGKAKIT